MEYKIIEGYPSDCQKILNQWKHKYELKIIAVNSLQYVQENNETAYRETWVVITLTRDKL